MTSNIILHRNLGSPYAERARLLLDYAGLDWNSCFTTKNYPRPTLEILSGGYSRRIPVLQIGADIYCDAYGIMTEIASRSGMQELHPQTLDGKTQELYQFIETIGNNAILSSFTIFDFLKGYFKNLPLKDAIAFFSDRKKLLKTDPSLKKLRDRKASLPVAQSYLHKLNECLSAASYLSRNSSPSAPDFAAFTMIWYQNMLTNSKVIQPYKNLISWFEFMSSHLKSADQKVDEITALTIAKEHTPQSVPDEMTSSPNLGKKFDIIPSDIFGRALNIPLSGTLVGENKSTYILKRDTPEIGTVHVHIPKKCTGACG
ncbi:glutathione S-transferase N-terminal domain-containing protein [Thalassomonas sp. RHCl1]|uniref:glutathione S-transferase N-terminal domain-containing protein n=1 Tax=Thalassomonas sp. RHCl1 TaxID=2995320 RepID=UPI00248B9D89|nr:glutathione S-transferase N-terminal domain-containing protein [Thalassomonas sp. RHCl1]